MVDRKERGGKGEWETRREREGGREREPRIRCSL
jgi:hypothetical protein